MHRVSSVPVLASQGTTADWECPSCLQDSCCSLPAWSCSACRGNAHTHASHSFPKGTWQEPAESFAQLMIALKLEIAHPDTFSLSPSLSLTHTPCLLRRKLRGRRKVPVAALIKQAHRGCRQGAPVSCQNFSYSESIMLAVI